MTGWVAAAGPFSSSPLALGALTFLAGLALSSWWLYRRTDAHARRLALRAEQAESAAAHLRKEEARLRSTIDGLGVGVTVHGQDGELLYANDAALALLGGTPTSGAGVKVFGADGEVLGEEGVPLGSGADLLRDVLASGHPVRHTVLGMRRGSGDLTWVLATVEPRPGPDGRPCEVVCIFNDITERRRALEQIRHLAYHDALTQLPNRELFFDRLGVALVQARRRKRGLAVLFVDLDGFKLINDSLGHSVGDVVLRSVARRAKAVVRGADTVARFGGDEFIVLLTAVEKKIDVLRISAKLHKAIRQPIQVDGRDLTLSASIGATVYPQDGANIETLIGNADIAMYRAKELGRDQTQLYAAGLGERACGQVDVAFRQRPRAGSRRTTSR